jgi:hypothetical protein
MLHIKLVVRRRDNCIGCVLELIENSLDDFKEQCGYCVLGATDGELLIGVAHKVQNYSGDLVGDILQHILIVFLIRNLRREDFDADYQTPLSIIGNLEFREAGTVAEIDNAAD